MLYICCTKRLYKYFEDYINSFVSKETIKLILTTDNLLFEFMKRVSEKDDDYKFILLTIPNMSIYNIGFFKHSRVYILNTEQLTKDNEIKKIQFYKDHGLKLIDYSQGNISISKDSLYLPYQVNHNEIKNYEKIYDACYVGTLFSKYRYNILKTLKINILGGKKPLWGEERDNILFKHKILVNVHHDKNYNVCEEMRINRCIFNKMIVISENGIGDDNLYLKKYIIFEKYENIKERLDDVLNNYDSYYNKIFSDFDIEEVDNHYKLMLNKFLEEIN